MKKNDSPIILYALVLISSLHYTIINSMDADYLLSKNIQTTYTATEYCESQNDTIPPQDSTTPQYKNNGLPIEKNNTFLTHKKKLALLGLTSFFTLKHYNFFRISPLAQYIVINSLFSMKKIANIATIAKTYPKISTIIFAGATTYIAVTKIAIFLITKKIIEQYYYFQLTIWPLYKETYFLPPEPLSRKQCLKIFWES